ncbi:MAG: hypothetical protein ACI4TE_09395, partial [Alphaproteobacteria bacterium]
EPKAYQNFYKNNKPIADDYFYAMQEKNDISYALSRAAKSWYDRTPEQMELFDRNVVAAMSSEGMGDCHAFAVNVSAGALCDIFSYYGSYMDKAFLSGKKANGIGEELASKIERVEKYHKNKFQGKNPNKVKTSADRFYVMSKDGTVRPPQKPASVIERLSAYLGR